MTSTGNPYTDVKNKRFFSVETDDEELVWHRDKKDRHITIIEGQAWQLQYNGSLPILLEEGKTYFIKAELFHRLIKGATNLEIEIKE